ncbi:Vacuolar amino acid transporter 5 [Cucumispora dikerogammari]|nr:Vacuolar amino acid transporter 5 [Cucumispora dikerogammari]
MELIKAFINLIKTVLGSGILYIPTMYKHYGIIYASILLFISYLLSIFGLLIYARCNIKIKNNHANIATFCEISIPQLKKTVELAIFLKCFGVATSYLIIVRDTICILLYTTFPFPIFKNTKVGILIFLLLIGPFTYYDQLNKLFYTSFIGVLSIMFILLSSVYRFCVLPLKGRDEIYFIRPIGYSFLSGLGVFMFAFVCHPNLVTLQNEIGYRQRQRNYRREREIGNRQTENFTSTTQDYVHNLLEGSSPNSQKAVGFNNTIEDQVDNSLEFNQKVLPKASVSNHNTIGDQANNSLKNHSLVPSREDVGNYINENYVDNIITENLLESLKLNHNHPINLLANTTILSQNPLELENTQNISQPDTNTESPSEYIMIKYLITVTATTSLIIYLIFGILNYLMFGNNLHDNVLRNYPADTLTNIMKISYVCVMAFSFPLQINPCRKYLYSLLNLKRRQTKSSFLLHFFVNTAILVIIYTLATTNLQLGDVYKIIGATVGSFICLILPPLFLLKMRLYESAFEIFVGFTMFFIGCFVFLIVVVEFMQ